MFRIRRIFDDAVPANRNALAQVGRILKNRFPTVSEHEVEAIGTKLKNPFKIGFKPVLYVVENLRQKVLGFALVLYEPQLGFCFLDWIATHTDTVTGGIGSALYSHVRSECVAMGARGLYFECLPDTGTGFSERRLAENIARLKFYERYGARPIIGTAYETPLDPEDDESPLLVYDGLDRDRPPGRDHLRQVIRAILERKYAHLCPPGCVEDVVASVKDNPARLRPFRYVKPGRAGKPVFGGFGEKITLVVSEGHAIHHIRERGYVESPVRIRSILNSLEKSGLFERIPADPFPDVHIHGVHDADFIAYLETACRQADSKKPLYPYVFPIRNKTRPPSDSSVLPGYYCIDTFTPIHRNAFPAARSAVDTALTAARSLLEGRRIAYGLVRPPGHHAEKRSFGGFCYLNNTAIAAQYLREHGRVAILDIDYHHGNGQQDIFYSRSDVLTVSIHGHPDFAYPYFNGFEDETGHGEGQGFNLNIPLGESVDGGAYRHALAKALGRVTAFDPDFLVVALGLDTARQDPTGTWSLTSRDFRLNGRLIGETGLPVLVIQEGGYRTRTLGTHAGYFFQGLAETVFGSGKAKAAQKSLPRGVRFRYTLRPSDVESIRALVTETGFFRPDEILIAAELVDERLKLGEKSGYHFVMAEKNGLLAGYGCFGPIPCTLTSHDIYWIAVAPKFQGKGLGKGILREMERLIREAGGIRVYVETSTQPNYAPTRMFYELCGYKCEAVLEDFYEPGDGKAIYSCRVGEPKAGPQTTP